MAPESTKVSGARVSRQEWRWVLGWSAVILLITSLPYLYGALISTPQSQFNGLVIGVVDGNSYLAKMRLGATDGWRYYIFYTSEPHPGAHLFLFHLLLGKVARLSGLSLVLVYHLARIGCGFFLLASVYRFAAFFSDVRPVRRLAFWMVGVGGGLGWLVTLLGLSDRLGLPLDFYSPEAFLFHALLALPHLSLAGGLLLWALPLLWVAWESHKLRYAWLAGLALLGMAIIAAFYIVIAAVVMGIGWLLRRWRMRREAARPPDPRRPPSRPGTGTGRAGGGWIEAGQAVLAFTIAAPAPLYNAYVFTTNPIFKIWAAQNLILSPPPVHYLLAFGPLALLAALGAWTEWRLGRGRDVGSMRRLWLIGWCAVVPLLVYIPFNLQRRLTLGVQVALSIWAALGLWRLAGSGRRWRIASTSLVALLSLTNLLILIGAGLEVSRRSPPLFHSGTVVGAADWLGAQATPDQVVLADFETSNYLPTRMSARVFAGHSPETVHVEMKLELLRRFFGENSDDFRRRLLADYGINYLFYGPAERVLGAFDPSQVSYLRQVYDNGGVQIYQVVNPGGR